MRLRTSALLAFVALALWSPAATAHADCSPGDSSCVTSGSTVLKGTYNFDFDTGTQGSRAPNFDVWWEQKTAVLRDMAPINGAQIVNLGSVNYDSLTRDALSGLAYSTTPIAGNNDGSNQLVPGDVFAVKTTDHNFAKVLVVDYGYDLSIQWTTYRGG